MRIPQIQMESQQAKIAIQTVAARQSIQQPKADVRIEQPQAEMKMRTTPGKLTIDQSQAWEEMNLKSTFKAVKENAVKGNQKVMEGIARVAQEGDEMIEIQNGQNAFVEQAKRHANPPLPEANITWIPSPLAVKSHYEPGRVEIQFQPKKPRIDAAIRKPIMNYSPGDVQIQLAQRNNLKIDLVK
ncbi:DUF6470 family protein [Lederbergia sp. NSJ-179]|uniref:DUF6470 family protein n=1 Tax=Lederbergia sp. NSJ-179 TaxID=2931402 RepID=UPI001FD09DE1|nr:DUF6470 family protein [Lederbergia sp. NSJ-179]MCJ7843293.1 DUF6470 family protein [Lederbergia sp. NSJ-179]